MNKSKIIEKNMHRLPWFLLAFLIVIDLVNWILDWKSGLFMTLCILAAGIVVYCVWRLRKEDLKALFTVNPAGEVRSQSRLLRNLPYPYAIVNAQGRLSWGNKAFFDNCIIDSLKPRTLSNIFPDVESFELPEEGIATYHVTQGEKKFRLTLERVIEPERIGMQMNDVLYALCMYDETEALRLERELREQRVVTGLACLDNYEEVAAIVDEIRLSLVTAHIDRRIQRYFSQRGGIVKKIERDRYFLIIPECRLEEMKEDHFSILQEIRDAKVGNDQHITMSLGFGMGEGSYGTRYEYSRVALDMALGRGGDQAAVKDGENITYYGGSAHTANRITRVKTRMKARTLRELLLKYDDVLIMAHRIPDLDAVGAAAGMYRIATFMGKKAHIVLDEVSNSVAPVKEKLMALNGDDVFVNGEQALSILSENTLIIVVDTNRAPYTEAPQLLEKTKNKVVIDHHRLANDSISDTLMSYVEPYASSACEMVVELLQYVDEKIRIRQDEADAMFAGIVMDTNNFVNRTGVRTFEAAAYLRKYGADSVRVKKQLFREGMDCIRAKADAINNVEIFLDRFAVGICPSEGLENPTIVSAQAANEMLDIKTVEASFVLTDYQNKIFISARSSDSVNVQIIMERLGGGGHGTMAGAQMTDCTIEQAKEYVKVTINEMVNEGEI